MNASELITRKRAIYTGLQPFLRDSELMEALILWESHYINEPKFSVRYFVGDLSRRINRPADAKKLFIHLVATMNKPTEQLLRDPTTALEAYKKRRNAAVVSQYATPEIEAFKVLVQKWLSLEKSSTSANINRFVILNLGRLKIDPNLKVQTARWLADEHKDIKVSHIQFRDLRKIIHLFYMAFCEHVGRVKADTLLADAVTRLNSNGGAAFSDIFARLL